MKEMAIGERGEIGENKGKVEGSIEKLQCWEREGSCLLYTSPSPRDRTRSRMPSSA